MRKGISKEDGMLSRLVSYMVWRGAASGADDGDAPTPDKEACGTTDGVTSIPVEARLRQVEVEGDDWILIDRNVEGVTGLDESWYVTPPACFTQPGPVHVETSPLEDLLIEHPSMSVYRAAKPSKSSASKDKSESTKQRKRRPMAIELLTNPSDIAAMPRSLRMPLHPRDMQAADKIKLNFRRAKNDNTLPEVKTPSTRNPRVDPYLHHHNVIDPHYENYRVNNRENNRESHRDNHRDNNRDNNRENHRAVEAPRRSSIRDLRNARGDENVRIVQIRSAQKMMEKRTSQSSKRNRLERGNKVREVSSGKGRRPRRQDRLRLNNSGANNNRKC